MPAGLEPSVRPSASPPWSSLIAFVRGEKRPMRPGVALVVNHSAPSPPSAMPAGRWLGVRPAVYSVIAPEVLRRAMAPGSLASVK
jgi:hypothetical protein